MGSKNKNYFALATFFFYKQDTKKVARAGKGSGESGTFVCVEISFLGEKLCLVFCMELQMVVRDVDS